MSKTADTQKVSQSARELAEKIIRHLGADADPAIAEAAALIDVELRELLKAMGNTDQLPRHSSPSQSWFFSEDQAPTYKAELNTANELYAKWQVKG